MPECPRTLTTLAQRTPSMSEAAQQLPLMAAVDQQRVMPRLLLVAATMRMLVLQTTTREAARIALAQTGQALRNFVARPLANPLARA